MDAPEQTGEEDVHVRVKGRQARLPVLGQIRFGTTEEATNREGKKYDRPVSLETFRFTSLSRKIIDAIAEEYGGTVENFKGGQGYEVITEAKSIHAYLPPSKDMALSSEMSWWSYRECKRRCDGEEEFTGSAPRPCLCKIEEERANDKGEAYKLKCKPDTRLKLLLPEMPGTGVWTLNTNSWEALDSFPGVVDMLFDWIKGKPTIEQLEVIVHLKRKKGKDKNGQATTWVVPVLTATKSLKALLSSGGGSDDAPELGAPVAPDGTQGGPDALPAAIEEFMDEASEKFHDDSAGGKDDGKGNSSQPESPAPPSEGEPATALTTASATKSSPVETPEPTFPSTAMGNVGRLLAKLELPPWENGVVYAPIFGRLLRKPELEAEDISEFTLERIASALEKVTAGTHKLPDDLEALKYDPFKDE